MEYLLVKTSPVKKLPTQSKRVHLLDTVFSPPLLFQLITRPSSRLLSSLTLTSEEIGDQRLSWICSKRCSQALGNVGAVANLPQMMKSDTRACFRRELSRWFVSLSWYFSTPSLSIFSSIEFTDRLLKATLTWYCFTVSFFPRDSRYPFSPTCRWESGTHKWTPGRLLVQMQWGAQEFLFFLTKTILSQIDRESNEICSILKPSSDCFNLVSDGLIVGSRLWYGTINQVWVKSFWPSSNKYGPP